MAQFDTFKTKKIDSKNADKATKWMDNETALLETLVDRENGFLQMIEFKALKKTPTPEVFASIFQVLKEALTEEGFVIKNSSNFHEKKPFNDLYLDVKKL